HYRQAHSPKRHLAPRAGPKSDPQGLQRVRQLGAHSVEVEIEALEVTTDKPTQRFHRLLPHALSVHQGHVIPSCWWPVRGPQSEASSSRRWSARNVGRAWSRASRTARVSRAARFRSTCSCSATLLTKALGEKRDIELSKERRLSSRRTGLGRDAARSWPTGQERHPASSVNTALAARSPSAAVSRAAAS